MSRSSNLAQRIRQAMELRQIKQVDLCKKTGIPKSAMSQYLNGMFEPKQDRLALLAHALGVNETWLLGYDDMPMEVDAVPPEQKLTGVYLSLALEAQENGIDPDDIKLAIDTIQRLRNK